jgi:hypothetical protein
MLSLEEARGRILAALAPTATETVALPEAWNRVLARPVVARLTQPPADVSAMDGYAVRAADAAVGARLAVIGAAPAGHPFAGEVGPGQAVRIFTGGFVPPGADAILLQEDAEEAAGTVTVNETVKPGRWIRRRGLDFAAGEALLPAGRRLTARDSSASPPPPTIPGSRCIGSRGSGSSRPATRSPCPASRFPRAASSPPTPMRWPRWCARRAASRWCCRSPPTTATPSPRPPARRGGATCWSRPAAPRSASTISCRRRSARADWRSISGRSRCGRASR